MTGKFLSKTRYHSIPPLSTGLITRPKGLKNIDNINQQIKYFNSLIIDIKLLRSVYGGEKSLKGEQFSWNRWKENCFRDELHDDEKETQKTHYRNRNLSKKDIYLIFTKPVPLPKYWDIYDRHTIECITERNNIIKARINELFQCLICSGGKCQRGSCRNFKRSNLIGKFCIQCGEFRGHYDGQCPLYGKKDQYCINCNSNDHCSKKSDQCPYWVGLAPSTLILNERFIRNKNWVKFYIRCRSIG